MALYEVDQNQLTEIPTGAFEALLLREREDLQRLLRNDISPLGEGLLVIAEEFGQWEDARRRIDLLAIDTAGRLVVIELKRTEGGGHMELQAIRYAAMVSALSFENVVDAYEAFLEQHHPGAETEARAKLESFLGADDTDEAPTISTEVRIVLVSAGFSREITSTVLWLNSFEGMDIRCVRLRPYDLGGRVVLDVQQVIPLPEAGDYQVKVRRKEAARERARARAADGRDLTKYHIVVNGTVLPAEPKRQAIRIMVEKLAEQGVPLSEFFECMPPRRMRRLPGQLRSEEDVKRELSRVVVSDEQVRRHFTNRALVDEDEDVTYVINKMWGTDTEPALARLAEAFPGAGVTFRAALEE